MPDVTETCLFVFDDPLLDYLNAMKVPELMSEFVSWLQKSDDNPLTIAVDAHFKLVSIHPFVDGNGRTARLLMNLLLMQAGYPPAIIRKEDRNQYISSIERLNSQARFLIIMRYYMKQ